MHPIPLATDPNAPPCRTCKGTGKERLESPTGAGVRERCHMCGGSGGRGVSVLVDHDPADLPSRDAVTELERKRTGTPARAELDAMIDAQEADYQPFGYNWRGEIVPVSNAMAEWRSQYELAGDIRVTASRVAELSKTRNRFAQSLEETERAKLEKMQAALSAWEATQKVAAQ